MSKTKTDPRVLEQIRLCHDRAMQESVEAFRRAIEADHKAAMEAVARRKRESEWFLARFSVAHVERVSARVSKFVRGLFK